MEAYQNILKAIAVLSDEDQDELFEMLCRKRIEMKQAEILANAQYLRKAAKNGTAYIGTADDLISYLTREDDETCLE